MISLSKFRENIFNISDEVIRSGVPVLIKRKGKILKISVEVPVDKLKPLAQLPKRKILKVEPDEIVHLDWSKEWRKNHDSA